MAAAARNNGSLIRYPDLKKDFLETMFLSKNPVLNTMMRRIVDGAVVKDDSLYGLIKAGNWRALDELMSTNPGKDTFFRILEQFFLFKYFLPEDERITRKEFEIAMGIQQVRWMVDPENCRIKKNSENTENGRVHTNYRVEKADFYYWQEIPEDERTEISEQINKQINLRLTNPIDYNRRFENTVWYKVLFIDSVGKKRTIGWDRYGKKLDFYPIPETLNISDIACVYQPKLVFGSLSDVSLLKFIINYKQRPYIAHLPNAKGNLCDIHDLKHAIVAGWQHDFHHSRSGVCNDVSLVYLNTYCKLDPKLNYTTLKDAINDETSQLMICLRGPGGEVKARAINDSGRIVHDPPFPHFAGGKRKTRRSVYKKNITRRRKRTTRK